MTRPKLPMRVTTDKFRITAAYLNCLADNIRALWRHPKGDGKTTIVSDTGVISCRVNGGPGGGGSGTPLRTVSIERYLGTFGVENSEEGGHVYLVTLNDSYLRSYTDGDKEYQWPPLDADGTPPDPEYDLFVIPRDLLLDEYVQNAPSSFPTWAVKVPYLLPERFFVKPVYDSAPQDGLCDVWIPADLSYFSGGGAVIASMY